MKKIIATAIAGLALTAVNANASGLTFHEYDFSFGTVSGTLDWHEFNGQVWAPGYTECSYDRSLDQDGYWLSHMGDNIQEATSNEFATIWTGYLTYYQNNMEFGDYALAKTCVIYQMAMYGVTEDSRLSGLDPMDQVRMAKIFRQGNNGDEDGAIAALGVIIGERELGVSTEDVTFAELFDDVAAAM